MRYHYLIRLGENFPLVIGHKLINTAQTSPSSKMSTTIIPQSRTPAQLTRKPNAKKTKGTKEKGKKIKFEPTFYKSHHKQSLPSLVLLKSQPTKL